MFIFKYSPIYILLIQNSGCENFSNLSCKSYQLFPDIPSPTPVRQGNNYVRHMRLFLTADWKLTFKLAGLVNF